MSVPSGKSSAKTGGVTSFDSRANLSIIWARTARQRKRGRRSVMVLHEAAHRTRQLASVIPVAVHLEHPLRRMRDKVTRPHITSRGAVQEGHKASILARVSQLRRDVREATHDAHLTLCLQRVTLVVQDRVKPASIVPDLEVQVLYDLRRLADRLQFQRFWVHLLESPSPQETCRSVESCLHIAQDRDDDVAPRHQSAAAEVRRRPASAPTRPARPDLQPRQFDRP